MRLLLLKFCTDCGKGLVMDIEASICLKCIFKVVPSGSGKGGKSSTPAPVGLIILFVSKSTSQTSSGSRKFVRLYMRKDAGTPMIYGVGASSNFIQQED